MDRWLKMGSLKKRKDTKQDLLDNNKETDATSTSCHISKTN
jgi:hypothetical protein